MQPARRIFSVAAVLGTAVFCSMAAAEPTRVEVRVLSKGAKFIGTSMGGAEVLVKDAQSGELLARGVTAGTTGDTAKIMQSSQPHHAPVATEDAGVFRTTLDLEEPRRVEIVARGPLAQPQAINTVTATQWVVPGKDLTGGDGFLLEMPGFVVDVLSPPAHQKFQGPQQTVQLKANVIMMCGCPIEPGGLWDANKFEVAAILKRNGERIGRVPLRYAGQTSQFAAAFDVAEPGSYEVVVYAYDPASGNTGLDKTTWVLSE